MKENTPKYIEIIQWIEQQILDKKLVPGQKMYSENELKDMFAVSRQTVRHAISVLEKDGILRKIQGSGTYINDSRMADLKKRTLVAVVTTYVDDYIFPRTIQGIEDVLFENGYSVQISFTNNQNSREKTILEDIINRDEVAGVIMETTKSGLPNQNLNLYREIQKRKIPILFINSYYPSLKIPHVSINDRMAGRRMTRYLISRGHCKIGGIFKLDDGQGLLRYAGYVDAMIEAGLAIDETRIVWVDTEDVKHLEKLHQKIIDRIKDCTGLFCYNDEVAAGVISILKVEGLKVPDNISIVSVDNSELAALGEVPLTSITHPMEKLGERAAENLLRMMKDPFYDGNYEFEVNIVKRNSVKRI